MGMLSTYGIRCHCLCVDPRLASAISADQLNGAMESAISASDCFREGIKMTLDEAKATLKSLPGVHEVTEFVVRDELAKPVYVRKEKGR